MWFLQMKQNHLHFREIKYCSYLLDHLSFTAYRQLFIISTKKKKGNALLKEAVNPPADRSDFSCCSESSTTNSEIFLEVAENVVINKQTKTQAKITPKSGIIRMHIYCTCLYLFLPKIPQKYDRQTDEHRSTKLKQKQFPHQILFLESLIQSIRCYHKVKSISRVILTNIARATRSTRKSQYQG